MKFVRRTDLDTDTRLNIIRQGLSRQGIYGEMKALAAQYNISRSFLYQLLGMALLCLHELLSTEHTIAPPAHLDVDSAIALLRLEGKVSISGISEILRTQGYKQSSTGTVSERLTHLGRNIPHTLTAVGEHHVFNLSDELFSLNRPILITIDPVSTAILRIELASNRNADTWKNHFEAVNAQFPSKGLGSDRGTGLMQGYQAACPDAIWCSDHFHEFRGLVHLREILEKQAYSAITAEDERRKVFDNACSDNNLEKRLQQLNEASALCEQKMAEYQHVSDVVDILLSSMYFFDLKTGEPRHKQSVKEDVLTLMELLDEINLPKLQVQTCKVREHINDICVCYHQVEDICKELSKTIPETTLNYIGLAWQHDHQSHQHKGEVKKYHKNECDFWLNAAISLIDEENAHVQIEQAFEQFNGMVRSSSLIEMVNSQVRPYLNSCKGQITQEHLNLIMFYHNHHIYKSGKRKGKSPIELLTGEKPEKHWLELLADTVSQTQ